MHETDKRDLNTLIREAADDILSSSRFQQAEKVCHHGTTTVAAHSMAVANCALSICLEMKAHGKGKDIDTTDVIRAALLHDIGMTDEDVYLRVSPVKAYAHPKRSAEIAVKEFHANEIQADAILHHMWPICVVPPKYEAGRILIAADKRVSVREVGNGITTEK